MTIVHRKELVERVSAVIEEMEAVSFPLTKANKQKIQAEVTHMKNCFEQLQESGRAQNGHYSHLNSLPLGVPFVTICNFIMFRHLEFEEISHLVF